ncbi:T-cell surface glycoprotein CD3 epsilon chain isoform X2 [Phyllobates terribilis]|uniref:T-cell surface glycoprotein CD3 epsilon chain isoform X2 n=1 Tax=Phyllobates terribilis TaxID=111132 RepID=UPI003CCB0F0D
MVFPAGDGSISPSCHRLVCCKGCSRRRWNRYGLHDHFLAQDQSLDEDRDHKFQVDITGLVVTITCPSGQNYIDDKEKKNQKTLNENKNQKILENYSSDKNGLHKCNHDFLYLHAYVCETCTEVSFLMVASVVIADCLITIGVCVFVYMFCKKKPAQTRENGFAKGARKKGNKELPPPVPNPDYEPIQKKRQEVYDGLNQNSK